MNIKDIDIDYKGPFDIKNEKRVIVYRTSKVRKENIPENLSKRKEVIPFHMNVPGSDVIKDKDDNAVTIGFVTRINPDKEVRFGTIALNQQNNGTIIIDPKKANARQVKLYYFLQNTDFNGSKKDRDTTKDILFVRLDKEGEAIARMAKKILVNKAENLFMALSDEDASAIVKALGDHNIQHEPLAIQKEQFLTEYIPAHPSVFIDKIESKNVDLDVKLREAAKRGIIEVIKKDGEVKYFEEVILKFSNQPGVKIYDKLIEELKANDPETLEAILGKLDQSEAEEKEKSS
jgi:hypothetical protein